MEEEIKGHNKSARIISGGKIFLTKIGHNVIIIKLLYYNGLVLGESYIDITLVDNYLLLTLFSRIVPNSSLLSFFSQSILYTMK